MTKSSEAAIVIIVTAGVVAIPVLGFMLGDWVGDAAARPLAFLSLHGLTVWAWISALAELCDPCEKEPSNEVR